MLENELDAIDFEPETEELDWSELESDFEQEALDWAAAIEGDYIE